MEVCAKLAAVDITVGSVLHLDALASAHWLPEGFLARVKRDKALRLALGLGAGANPELVRDTLRRLVAGGRGGFLVDVEQPRYEERDGMLCALWGQPERAIFRAAAYPAALDKAYRWGRARLDVALAKSGMLIDAAA